MSDTRIPFFAIGLAAVAGCAPSLAASGDPDAGSVDAGALPDGSIPPSSGHFTHASGEDGIITTVADATSQTEWIYLDLDTGLDVGAEGDWDIGFRRYFVITNGGVSGARGGAAARLPGVALDAIDEAPESGWRVDLPDSEEDDDEGPDTAFNGGPGGENDWYDYDPATHRLSRREVSFAVRGANGTFFALEILSYYDMAGTPGVMSFRWRPISGGEVMLPDAGPITVPDGGMPTDGGGVVVPPDAITVDASDRDAWVYVSIEGGVISVADPATSTSWDLALRRAAIRTNGGASGPGVGGARATEESDPEAVSSTGTLGFVVDELIEPGMPGGTAEPGNAVIGDWFDYDFATHTLSARPITYVVRGGEGEYGRVRVWAWADGVYQLSIAPVVASPETVEIDVDASSSETWAYVDLHSGAVVTVGDPPEDDARWDLGLRRTQMRTQSGTTSAREGGAIDAMEADYAAVSALPETGWVLDSERTIPGPPGSPTYSGNAALETWFDYDPETHVVTPRATTFFVRLADGSGGKLAVTSWASGAYRLRWTYAGPMRSGL